MVAFINTIIHNYITGNIYQLTQQQLRFLSIVARIIIAGGIRLRTERLYQKYDPHMTTYSTISCCQILMKWTFTIMM